MGKNVSALYGTFNIHMEPLITIDVTEKLLHFFDESGIKIKHNEAFKDLFGVLENDSEKFLQVKVDDKVYNIAEDNYQYDVYIPFGEKWKSIKIVYYLFINPNSNWKGIISGQLLQLKSYGILSESDLYVHISSSQTLKNQVESLIMEIVPSAILSFNEDNLYEYPGIKLIHQLAIDNSEDNFIYFHSKGMAHNLHSRNVDEINLFAGTFKNWRKNIQELNRNGIQKIGLFPACLNEHNYKRRGWIWYNYWYASGSYLSNCPEPIKTDDRYYYEGWLSLRKVRDEILNDCFSLYKIKGLNKNYFTPVEADYHLSLLQKKSFKLSKRIFQAFGNAKLAQYYTVFEDKLNLIKHKLK